VSTHTRLLAGYCACVDLFVLADLHWRRRHHAETAPLHTSEHHPQMTQNVVHVSYFHMTMIAQCFDIVSIRRWHRRQPMDPVTT
jgi:hypothetical protein